MNGVVWLLAIIAICAIDAMLEGHEFSQGVLLGAVILSVVTATTQP